MICLIDEDLKEIEKNRDLKTIFADVILWKRPMDMKLFLLVGKFISSEKFNVSYVVPEDVRAVAHDVLRHRIGLSYEAEANNITSEEIVSQIINKVEVP